jgi:hypothetical protein
VIALVFSILSVAQGRYLTALWCGLFAVAATCWLIAVNLPTTCGVTTLEGRACPNRTTGVLFGCSQAKGHIWAKFFARFGWSRKVPPPRRATTLSEPEPKPGHPGVEEDKRSRILFWATFVATTAGTISMTTDIIGLFN